MLLLRFAFFNNMLLLRFGLLILSFIQWDLSFVEWKMTPSWPCLEKTFLYNCWCLRQSVHSISSAGFACDLCWHGDEVVWQWDLYPGAPLTYFNDGGGRGSDRGSYFIPKIITTSKFVYPKKSLLFFSMPKRSLGPLSATQKNPSVFLSTQKNPGVFHRPKRITLGQNFRPKKITRTLPVIKICKWGPWGSLLGCGWLCRSNLKFRAAQATLSVCSLWTARVGVVLRRIVADCDCRFDKLCGS